MVCAALSDGRLILSHGVGEGSSAINDAWLMSTATAPPYTWSTAAAPPPQNSSGAWGTLYGDELVVQLPSATAPPGQLAQWDSSGNWSSILTPSNSQSLPARLVDYHAK